MTPSNRINTCLIIINFANPDMVGHTGVHAIQAIASFLGKAVDTIKEVNGQLFICAET